MQRTSGQTSQISKSPTKDRFVRNSLDLIRNTLTLLARGFFKEVDGERYSVVLPEALFSPWRVDANFRKTYDRIAPYTLVDIYRCYELWQLVDQLAPRGGHILEVGVWRGGQVASWLPWPKLLIRVRRSFCAILSKELSRRESKMGTRQASWRTHRRKSLRRSSRNWAFATCRILEGVFPEETAHLIEAGEFGLCHIDVDVYQSARDAAEWVWPRLQVGGVIVFDDYGSAKSGGVARYVDSLAGWNGLIRVHNLNGHGLIIKTSTGPLPAETRLAESATL